MRIFAQDKAKNWIEGRIQAALKNKKISILVILIIISGFFFYSQITGIFPKCFADDFKIGGHLEHEKEWINKINYIENTDSVQELSKEDLYLASSIENIKKSGKAVQEEEIKSQLYQLVGNSPIREMVPHIMKLDNKVAAFVVGIAKKESDWGRHAPSQGGRTCYNYWGYKGSGSRGTSMGYACFGNSKEAVETVGKRIDTLVSKNINEPKKMLVWKCGSSCAGHDPAGVQKWVSDVNLYFDKVMQIRII
jgi:hypothetical protein